MTTTAKIAIAAVIIAALAAVIGYDLMFGKPKSQGAADAAPRNEAGLTILPENGPSSSPADLIRDVEHREAGVGVAPVQPAAEPPSAPIAPPATLPDPAPSNEEYVVQSGETLANIAERKYGDPNKWTVIAKANRNVNPNKMKIGTKLILPSESAALPVENVSLEPAPAATTPGAPRNYTIQAGDVLSKIAKKFYGTASAASKIIQANPEVLKDPDFLTVGATIVLPEASAAPVTATTQGSTAAPSTTEVDPATPTGRTHTVTRGESLWKIAEKHHGGAGVLAYMDKLVSANPDKLGSKNTPLRTGWVLALPE